MCTLSPASQIVETLLSAPHAPIQVKSSGPAWEDKLTVSGRKGAGPTCSRTAKRTRACGHNNDHHHIHTYTLTHTVDVC